MKQHIEFKCNCYRTGCIFCDGGLFLCAVCNSFEGAMTTECPSRRMTSQESAEVYEGLVDFIGGKWKEQASPHSPAGTRERMANVKANNN